MTRTATTFSMPKPRPYQSAAADAFYDLGGDGIIEMFTGAGKTVLCGLIARRLKDHAGERPGRTVFLAHTDELVRQTCRTMLRMGLWPTVEKADEYHGDEYIPDQRERRKLFGKDFPTTDWFQFGRILCSSMQTFVGRTDKYREGGFDLCIIDEAHLSRCKTYHTIVDRLRAFNPHMRLLGVTATPFRADGKNLGTMFPKFFYRMRILDGIEQGYLVPVRCEKAVARGIDESVWKVGNTKHGRDVTDGSLSKSMDNDECIESIAHEIIDRGEGRKGIVFLPGIKVAESVTAALNALRPGIATFVHGKVPKQERKRRVRMHEDGDVKLMVGVMAMTTGYDVPDVSLVVLARMTKSKGLVAQKIGRGLRVLAHCIEGKDTPEERRAAIAASDKKDCLILDFANSSRHRFASADDVLLSSDDPKLADFVRKHKEPTDKRQVREQLEELESLYEFEDALRSTGGPPPKATFTYEQVNLFGSGGYQKDLQPLKTDDVRRPTNELVSQAWDVMIPPERAEQMTHNQLQAEVAKRRELKCGRKNFGFLVGVCKVEKGLIDSLRINWHDAQYLKKLFNSRPQKNLPHNWQELMLKARKERAHGGGK